MLLAMQWYDSAIPSKRNTVLTCDASASRGSTLPQGGDRFLVLRNHIPSTLVRKRIVNQCCAKWVFKFMQF